MLPAAGLRLVVAEERGPAQKKGGGGAAGWAADGGAGPLEQSPAAGVRLLSLSVKMFRETGPAEKVIFPRGMAYVRPGP